MKKVLIILTVLTCLTLGVTLVFAALNTTITTTYTFPGTTITFTPSTNVTVGVNSVAQSFAANSKHLNGNRTFGTGSDSSNIYWQTSSSGSPLAGPPSASVAADAFSGWSTL